MGIVRNRVKNQDGVDHLVNRLYSDLRTTPVVVITIPFHSSLDDYNLDALDEVEGRCDLQIIEIGDLTRLFSDKLQRGAAVYNGACRVYPMGFTKTTDPDTLPVRYIQNPGDLGKLLADVWANADVSEYKEERIQKARPAKGKVKQFFEARALVQLENGAGLATIRQELSFPGVPLEWIYSIGDQVDGLWDSADGLFIPTSSTMSIHDVVESVGLGNLTLGLVTEVDRQTGKIKLLPNLELDITRQEISHNDRDLVEDLLDVGDVVEVRLYRHDQGSIRVRMDDVDDDEVLYPALPLTPGGQPWLRADRVMPAAPGLSNMPQEVLEEFVPIEFPEDETQTGPIKVAPLSPAAIWAATHGDKPASTKPVDKNKESMAQWEAKRYREKLKEANETIARLIDEKNYKHKIWLEAEAELEKIRRQARAESSSAKRVRLVSGRTSSTTWSRRNRFDNDVDWFNEELRRAWIGRYLPSDRKKYALDFNKFSYASGFFDSLRADVADEEGIRKSVRVILDVVTGRENDDRKYEVHDLREGDKAGSASIVRADGAEAKRAYVEQNIPQARRLHFWKLKNNDLEIVSVGKHDKYRL